MNKSFTDREYILEDIKQDVEILRYVSEWLLDDEEFILEAIEYNPEAIKYASPRLKNDIDFLLEALEYNIECLKYMFYNEEIRSTEFEEKIRKTYQEYFLHSQKEKKAHNFLNRLIKIISNMEEDNQFLQEQKKLSDNKRDLLNINEDNGIILGVDKTLPIPNVPVGLKRRSYDEDIQNALKKIKQNHTLFQYAPLAIRSNRQVVTEVVAKDAYLFEYADEDLRNDPTFVLELIKTTPQVFIYAGPKIQTDFEIAFEAIKQDFNNIKYVSSKLRKDPKFKLEIIKIHPEVLDSEENIPEKKHTKPKL